MFSPENEDNGHSANVNEAFSRNISDIPVPDTPPPTYGALARQISYVSNISQTSSQRKVQLCFTVFIVDLYALRIHSACYSPN